MGTAVKKWCAIFIIRAPLRYHAAATRNFLQEDLMAKGNNARKKETKKPKKDKK